METTLFRYLDDLASRIDAPQEERKRREWEDFLNDRWPGDYFHPSERVPSPPKIDWPAVSVNAAMGDFDAMLLQQFRGCSETLASGGAAPLAVRCNYGSSILPSLFGVELFLMAEELNTLPTSHPLHSTDAIRRLVDAGVPDLHTGLGGKVFEAAGRFLEALESHPVLRRHIDLYHPDVQGPMDAAEVIWGSDIFYAFGDEPELLTAFLNLITETYIAFMRRWYELVPQTRDWSTHWSMAHKGALMLRNDSLMNLSPAMYVEYVRPFDQRLFDEFGGGAIHFCGRGDHFIEPLSQLRGLHAVNVAQPHLNNMETVLRHTVDKGIKLIGLGPGTVESLGLPLRGQVHCG
ncbi:MAG: hypothetical protein PHQ12_02355 [Chthoniobacteraceae bacterium]|nr:hypothetical protein [Chthoniobacteraceae bacterium]